MPSALRSTVVVLATLAAVVFLAGCQGKEIAVANQLFTTTTNHLNAEFDAGHVDDKTWLDVILPSLEAANAIRKEWNEAFIAGRAFDWRSAARNFYAAMATPLRQSTALGGSSNANPVSP